MRRGCETPCCGFMDVDLAPLAKQAVEVAGLTARRHQLHGETSKGTAAGSAASKNGMLGLLDKLEATDEGTRLETLRQLGLVFDMAEGEVEVDALSSLMREGEGAARLCPMLAHAEEWVRMTALRLLASFCRDVVIRRQLEGAGGSPLVVPYLFTTDPKTMALALQLTRHLCDSLAFIAKLQQGGGVARLQARKLVHLSLPSPFPRPRPLSRPVTFD